MLSSTCYNRELLFCLMQKRKLSDMLGPQWSKEELERFYEAYRKHGKDWKKVSANCKARSGSVILSGSKSTLEIPLLIALFKFSLAAVSEIPSNKYNIFWEYLKVTF